VNAGLPGAVMRFFARGAATELLWVNRSTSVKSKGVVRSKGLRYPHIYDLYTTYSHLVVLLIYNYLVKLVTYISIKNY